MKSSTKTLIAAGAGAAIVGLIAVIASPKSNASSGQVQVLHGHRYRLSHVYPSGTQPPSVAVMQQKIDVLMPNTWRVVSSSFDIDRSVGTFIADMIGQTHYEMTVGGSIEDMGPTP